MCVCVSVCVCEEAVTLSWHHHPVCHLFLSLTSPCFPPCGQHAHTYALSLCLCLTCLSHTHMICEHTSHALTCIVWMLRLNKCIGTHVTHTHLSKCTDDHMLHIMQWMSLTMYAAWSRMGDSNISNHIIVTEKSFHYKSTVEFVLYLSIYVAALHDGCHVRVCVCVLNSCRRQIAEGFCLLQGQACPSLQASALWWLSWRWSVSDRRDHMC